MDLCTTASIEIPLAGLQADNLGLRQPQYSLATVSTGLQLSPPLCGRRTLDLGFAVSSTCYHVVIRARFTSFCFPLKEVGFSLTLKATTTELPVWYEGIGVGAGGRTPDGDLGALFPQGWDGSATTSWET